MTTTTTTHDHRDSTAESGESVVVNKGDSPSDNEWPGITTPMQGMNRNHNQEIRYDEEEVLFPTPTSLFPTPSSTSTTTPTVTTRSGRVSRPSQRLIEEMGEALIMNAMLSELNLATVDGRQKEEEENTTENENETGYKEYSEDEEYSEYTVSDDYETEVTENDTITGNQEEYQECHRTSTAHIR